MFYASTAYKKTAGSTVSVRLEMITKDGRFGSRDAYKSVSAGQTVITQWQTVITQWGQRLGGLPGLLPQLLGVTPTAAVLLAQRIGGTWRPVWMVSMPEGSPQPDVFLDAVTGMPVTPDHTRQPPG
uniref:Uncharacterized protein n=1 Tax=Streptomyces sp. NBC_00049 TaxID=2903617 RepID=A0AAU2K0X6_9ACTN